MTKPTEDQPATVPLARQAGEIPPEWRWVGAVNPMTPIVEAFRRLLLGVGTVDPFHVLCSMVTTAVVTLAGLMLFSRIEKTFVDIV